MFLLFDYSKNIYYVISMTPRKQVQVQHGDQRTQKTDNIQWQRAT